MGSSPISSFPSVQLTTWNWIGRRVDEPLLELDAQEKC